MRSYRVLIIDDSEQIRELLKLKLKRWGHVVYEANNGQTGLELMKKHDIHFVITDWMMPDLNGIQVCEQIRETFNDRYVYIILLTAKSALEDLAKGMEAGADDFIAKPFHLSELQARVSAGIRILELERQLLEQRQKLDEAYSRIEQDLNYAARLQRSLLPPPCHVKNRYRAYSLFVPSRYLAGDIYNVIDVDETHTLFYVLDVAGKGVPAALLSFSLSKMLSPLDVGEGSTLRGINLIEPATAVKELNRAFHFKGDLHDLQYFTMIYGVINHDLREVRLVQAGHPAPIMLRASGEASFLGEGGHPVGLWPPDKSVYKETVFSYDRGDRLFLYSDGVSEMFNEDGEPFDENRLKKSLLSCRETDLETSLGQVLNHLEAWSGKSEFEDDVTLCGLEFY